MAVLTALVTEAISWADAIPLPGMPLYRWQVRIAVPDPTPDPPMIIGEGLIGSAYIADLAWLDVTQDCEGVSYERGSEAGGVPEAGELTLRLRNAERQWSPYRSAWYGPGTVIQIAVGTENNSTFKSQYVGLVTNWKVIDSELGVDSYVDITALEPFFLLAKADRVAVAAVGEGESPSSRLTRIQNDIDWQFGGTSNGLNPNGYGTTATDLSGYPMVEVRKVAQSFDAQVLSDKRGRLAIYGRGLDAVDVDETWFEVGAVISLTSLPNNANKDGGTVPYVTGSFVTANDDTLLISELNLAHAWASGADLVTYTQESVQRYQTRKVTIDDIVNDGDGLSLDWLATEILSRGDTTYRPDSIDVTSLHGEAAVRFLLAAEITQTVPKIEVERLIGGVPELTFENYSICRVSNYVRPCAGTLIWDATFEFDVEATSAAVITEEIASEWDEGLWDAAVWQ